MDRVPRPGHADYTYQVKYGVRATSGGGRSSARETIGRVAAGAVAEKWLREQYGTEVVSFVASVGEIQVPPEGMHHASGRPWTRQEIDKLGSLRLLRNPDIWHLVGEDEVQDEQARKDLQAKLEKDDEAAFLADMTKATQPCYEDTSGAVYNRNGEPVEVDASALEKMRTTNLIPVRCPHVATACKIATCIR